MTAKPRPLPHANNGGDPVLRLIVAAALLLPSSAILVARAISVGVAVEQRNESMRGRADDVRSQLQCARPSRMLAA
ncbi:MAG: hypothetical protein IT383_11155 [Deltaproteobacteria bacterium]|nr:hypothetical protein [Deltaproteobacteria bacterium]